METLKGLEWLISERWPKLKKQALAEQDPEKLIALLEEIDNLLFILETRIAGQDGIVRPGRESTSSRQKSIYRTPRGDTEIVNQ
ncbi:MAG TPA: hypothetical protein VI386_07110 [Candidatus Sulfotelmatobacter sp.]